MITKIERFKESFNFNIEKVRPESKEELKNLIYEAIEMYGNECDLNFIDTSLITNMSWLFNIWREFNGDISEWDVSNVTNTSNMFYTSKFMGDISKWDVSNVKDMRDMFYNSELLKQNKLPSWYKNVITKIEHFKENFNFNIEKIQPKDLGELTNLIRETINQYGNECDLNFIDTSLITDMSWLFNTWPEFNGDISNWNVSNVIYMDSMFHSSKFKGDISGWNTSNVTNMYSMFKNSKFNGDIDDWDINPNCITRYMFANSELEKKNKLPVWYNM